MYSDQSLKLRLDIDDFGLDTTSGRGIKAAAYLYHLTLIGNLCYPGKLVTTRFLRSEYIQ